MYASTPAEKAGETAKAAKSAKPAKSAKSVKSAKSAKSGKSGASRKASETNVRAMPARSKRSERAASAESAPARLKRTATRKAESRRMSEPASAAGKTSRKRMGGAETHEAEAREQKKRAKAKERASRQFDRQYGGRASAEGANEGAPRAAVYKGEMGASQRKSARMQRASEAGSWSAKLDPSGWLSRINLSSRTARLVTGAVCAVFVCAFLYTPMQQYYQAVRENARLAVEYEAVTERNVALDEHNESLASDAGMEDAVRQKYGYIVAGEQTAVVTGLSDEVDASKRANAEVEANILSSSIKAPEEWYTPILDAIFGVE